MTHRVFGMRGLGEEAVSGATTVSEGAQGDSPVSGAGAGAETGGGLSQFFGQLSLPVLLIGAVLVFMMFSSGDGSSGEN